MSDDIDYYPEEYLNRLMHDGANGIWIYTRFSDLLPSSIIKEYGKGYQLLENTEDVRSFLKTACEGKYSEKEIDAPDQLKLFEDDHVFVLYGTDSIGLGNKVAAKVRDIMKGGRD